TRRRRWWRDGATSTIWRGSWSGWPPTRRCAGASRRQAPRWSRRRSTGIGRWRGWSSCFRTRALVRVEPETERVDLPLETREAPREPVSLLAKRLRQRHHRVDQPTLAVVGGRNLVHAPSRPEMRSHRAKQMPAMPDAYLAAAVVRRLTR